MTIRIRDVQTHELDSILALNNAAGPSILPLDAGRLRHLFEHAEYFRVAERDGNLSGFLIALGPQADYGSSNYHWFQSHLPDFLYIDRVVVASRRRGGGVGRALYADVQSYAETRYPVLACEILLETGNDLALLFHGSVDFRETGQHVMHENGRRCSMLTKSLCSFDWIRRTYGTDLPEAPWLLKPRVDVALKPTGT